MKFISLENVLLPVPPNWELNENAQTYSGPEGLLDPRITTVESEINTDRLESALEKMRSKNGTSEIFWKEGISHLFCSYAHSGCMVYTFTIPLMGGVELNAVYVFKPGNEALAEEVKLYIKSNEKMKNERM